MKPVLSMLILALASGANVWMFTGYLSAGAAATTILLTIIVGLDAICDACKTKKH